MTTSLKERSSRGRRPDLPADVELRILLDACLTVLRRSGYEHATLNDVLSESGLSTRALYRHFRTKDDLLRTVFVRDASEAVNRVATAVRAAASPRDGVERWVHEILSFSYSKGRVNRAHVLGVGGRTPPPPLEQEFHRMRVRFLEPLVEVLKEGRMDGSLPGAEPVVDAQTIMGIIASLIGGSGGLARPGMARDTAHAYVMSWVFPKLTDSLGGT